MTDRSGSQPESKRSSFPCPYIAGDSVKPFRSMADGKMYDSKSTYFESLKRNECLVVEDGE